jgi:guanylate kinase
VTGTDVEGKPEGDVFILTAPSGSGKTTLAYRLVRSVSRLRFSRSATTRPPRAGETPGLDYSFVSDDEFDRMTEEGELLEWAHVHGHRYGTPAAFVEETVAGGEDVILNIDVQGALAVKDRLPEAVSIFLLPPSFEELKRRLEGRPGDTDDVADRLRTGFHEVGVISRFDYVVVNDDLEQALDMLRAIVLSRRCARARQLPAVEPILEDFRRAEEESG